MDLLAIIPAGIFLLVVIVKQINQYERGVMFTLGKFTGIKGQDGGSLFLFFNQ